MFTPQIQMSGIIISDGGQFTISHAAKHQQEYARFIGIYVDESRRLVKYIVKLSKPLGRIGMSLALVDAVRAAEQLGRYSSLAREVIIGDSDDSAITVDVSNFYDPAAYERRITQKRDGHTTTHAVPNTD